ncbi:MAG: aminotransferase class V-fold PLP-dependent enzyme [Pseudomonadota bacterium]
MIGASKDEIAFIKNTSEGLSFVAGGLPWSAGDNVITTSYEFPSNLYPWLSLETKGVEVRLLSPKDGRVPAEKIFDAADGRTRLITISSVEFINGFRHDLGRIGGFCKKKGILFCVDAIQSLGVIPINVKDCNIDFLAADGHKWLLSIEGIGGFYISRDMMDRLIPIEYGWHSVRNPLEFEKIDFTLDPTARRYEPGSFNLLSISILASSLELTLQTGIEKIYERVIGLIDHLLRLLDPSWKVISPLAEGERSGILTFTIPGVNPRDLSRKLLEKKVVVSARGGGIRVSPHFYNTHEELERFAELLKESISELPGS